MSTQDELELMLRRRATVRDEVWQHPLDAALMRDAADEIELLRAPAPAPAPGDGDALDTVWVFTHDRVGSVHASREDAQRAAEDCARVSGMKYDGWERQAANPNAPEPGWETWTLAVRSTTNSAAHTWRVDRRPVRAALSGGGAAVERHNKFDVNCALNADNGWIAYGAVCAVCSPSTAPAPDAGEVEDLTEEPPFGSVVLDSDGDAWQRRGDGWHLAMESDPYTWEKLRRGDTLRLIHRPAASPGDAQ